MHIILASTCAGAVSGLHLLPIYPSSGDGGFAPLTYQDVDPRFGTWEDVKALGAEYDLQMECMVNHISPASKEFQDYLAKGDKSEYKEMFIDWNKLWGGGPCTSTCLTWLHFWSYTMHIHSTTDHV